nr:hypothetical protein GCM10025730_33400 [Promicromonospora thailandica]
MALEAMWTRFLPHMARVREIIASGVLGEVRTLLVDHTQDLPDDPAHRINDLALGGGSLLDLGIYPVSFAWDLFGEPLTIQSHATFKETGADATVATIFGYDGARVATTVSASDTRGPNRASILGTEGRIEIDATWYNPSTVHVYDASGTETETFTAEVTGRGMHFQAAEAERLVAAGELDSPLLPRAETVAIMATLDEIRNQIDLKYPGSRPPRPRRDLHQISARTARLLLAQDRLDEARELLVQLVAPQLDVVCAAVHDRAGEPGLAQRAEVVRRRRLRQVEPHRAVALGVGLAVGQHADDLQAHGVGEGPQHVDELDLRHVGGRELGHDPSPDAIVRQPSNHSVTLNGMTFIEQSYSLRGAYLRIALIAAALFVVGTNAFVIAGVLPQIAVDIGASPSAVSYSISWYAVVVAVLAPAVSVLFARASRAALMGTGLWIIAAGIALSALAGDLALFTAGRVLAALGGAALMPAAMAAAPTLVPRSSAGGRSASSGSASSSPPPSARPWARRSRPSAAGGSRSASSPGWPRGSPSPSASPRAPCPPVPCPASWPGSPCCATSGSASPS